MFVFPPGSNRLDIVQVGNQAIPLGTTDLVSISLPPGQGTNLPVTIRASGFTNDVPIRVVVIPESGSSTNYNSVIATAGGAATASVTVNVPGGTISRIYAWTR